MLETLAQPACCRLTIVLLHFIWQGGLIAAGLWLVLRSRAVRRPEVLYTLSLAALGLMAAMPVATYALSADGPSALIHDAPPAESGRGRTDAPWLAQTQPYLLLAWMAGVGLLAARLAAGAVGVWELRRGRLELPAALADRLRGLGRRVGVGSRVFASTCAAQAVALGYWRPIILLPASWVTGLPPDLLEAVVAHELAHIRRGDLWVNLAQRVIETLLFYHPAVWWVSRQVRRHRELCCDELAVQFTGRRTVYARALHEVGCRTPVGRQTALATAITGDRDTFLLHRVRMVLGVERGSEAGQWWPAGLLAAALSAMAWLSSVGLPSSVGQALAQTDGQRGAQFRRGAPEGNRRAYLPRAEGDRETPATRGAAEGTARGFQPQSAREDTLMQMVQQLRQEVDQLRAELKEARQEHAAGAQRTSSTRAREPAALAEEPARVSPQDEERARPRSGPRDGDVPRIGPRDGDTPRVGPRDGDVPRSGPRDGDVPRVGPREGDTPRAGPRAEEAEANRYRRSPETER